MLVDLRTILTAAQTGGYAVGAFNVYNLEGVRAVIGAAEAARSPVILQFHPSALSYGGQALIALCLAAAREASVPTAVHLDHSPTHAAMRAALEAGLRSVMADGAHLSYAENVAFTSEAVALARAFDGAVEGELGLLSGTEDGLTVHERAAKMTDPAEAAGFVAETSIDALAVCIGNVHGRYHGEPRLDFERLAAIQGNVAVPLVLHGASGLPPTAIARAIALGVCKFNVNTEVRAAYVAALRRGLVSENADLLNLLQGAITAMQDVVGEKLRLFGSVNRATAAQEA
jgi:tagatose 1,6-diphosphate aldolase GatY/KbaY